MPETLTILKPLLYLLIGYLLGKSPWDFRAFASSLLTLVIIPLIIIFNISAPHKGTFTVITAFIVVMTILLLISRRISKDPVSNLAYCYLNIGWLGMPVATTLFGHSASLLAVSAYIGGSVFGNTVSPALMQGGGSFKTHIKQSLKRPPILALIIGLLLMPAGQQLHAHTVAIFSVVKFLMSSLGMAVLGMWLAQTEIRLKDLTARIPTFVIRGVLLFCLMNLLLWFGHYENIPLITENKSTLYMFCLLPPAANIVILETYYLKSGKATTVVACETCISVVCLGVFAVWVM